MLVVNDHLECDWQAAHSLFTEANEETNEESEYNDRIRIMSQTEHRA